jgi:signal transduction histidine kinase
MNQNLQNIWDFLQADKTLSEEQKNILLKTIKDVDKEMEIISFKLDRTEKVKRTTAILLEETIEELEQRRKAVEAQNRELEIESALERVRIKALGMQKPADMLDICKVISKQLESLNVKNIRNVQTAIFYPSKGTYFNYEYYSRHDKLLITEVDYRTHEMQELFANQMQQGAGELFTYPLEGQELKDWYNYQKTTNQFVDVFLETAHSLNYYWYSLGPVALGISTYSPLNEEEIHLFKHFRNVFDLAYRRYIDIEIAIAQALQAEQDLIEIKIAKQKAEDALTKLKATQAQLIHAEKMASLGELTAGIAHEIQNPLNFVNNFSEVSIELIDELKQESAVSGRRSAVSGQQSSIEIMDDIRQNLDKILYHGKRADAIVKGMLQHSRTSTGQKEPTDINALADEFLRLAYHGLRAKDNSFNADFRLEQDESLRQINIVPQEIGRVLLNLINNAFYAVNIKNLSGSQNLTGLEYKPMVVVSTKRPLSLQGEGRGEVLISVKDNGNGIPQKILDKIFQPFFTTKPTGQGTGLGLSLSYDIVKAHGGELKVETKEGEGTEFIIQLPE